MTGWLNGLSSGFAIIVAQMFGAKKYDDMRHFVAMSIYLMFGFLLYYDHRILAFNVPILRLMNSPADLMGDVAGYRGELFMPVFLLPRRIIRWSRFCVHWEIRNPRCIF